jgi:hypothetical protein
MTQDELIQRIAIIGDTSIEEALRAVVKLHRPEAQEHVEYEKCWNCNLIYPCPTIQAIEKELS